MSSKKVLVVAGPTASGKSDLGIVLAKALRGEATMEKAVYWTKQATRAFAKRQLTWFRHDPRVIWLSAEGESAENVASRIFALLKERFGDEIMAK